MHEKQTKQQCKLTVYKQKQLVEDNEMLKKFYLDLQVGQNQSPSGDTLIRTHL